MEEQLCSYIDEINITKIEELLARGANATIVTTNGRSAIGYAAFKGVSTILRILLNSCNDDNNSSSSSSAGNVKNHKCSSTDRIVVNCGGGGGGGGGDSFDQTPEGMDGLQWEEEIQCTGQLCEDEWSKLYIYYAQMIEKTGDILSNTIKSKDPHCLDAFNHAPIHYSAMIGDIIGTELLLKYRSPVDITTNMGFTGLHLAVENPEVVRILLQHKANPNKQNFHNMETPLHTAARIGKLEVVSMLIDAGADINATCMMDRTPLVLAIASKNFDITNLLIDRGAKLNTQDVQGFTPLYLSVVVRNVDLTERLLRLGARIFINHYLLHYCVRNDLVDIIRCLVQQGGDNVNIREPSGWTPILLAISNNNAILVKLLIELGAELNRDDLIMKELHIAIQESITINHFDEITKILIQYGVNIDNCNYWGESPLVHAIMCEKYDMAVILLREGAQVNSLDCTNVDDINDNRCPDSLLVTQRSNNVNLIKILVNAGLKIHNIPKKIKLKPPPWINIDTNYDDFLGFTCNNALSLQQLCRIQIRSKLLATMKNNKFTIPQQCGGGVGGGGNTNRNKLQKQNLDGSVLKYLISLLGLPKLLQSFLYNI